MYLLSYTFAQVAALRDKKDLRPMLNHYRREVCGGRKPESVQSDNGSEFVNRKLTKYFSGLGLVPKHGKPYYPQAQGQVVTIRSFGLFSGGASGSNHH